MMKVAIILFAVLAFEAHSIDRDVKFEPSVFEVNVLNSPVKESIAKFQLKLPTGFEVESLSAKLIKSTDLKNNEKAFEAVNLKGSQFSISVTKLPPGFYRLHLKAKDKKTGEHLYRSKYHDYVRVVIDDTAQVPLPDPLKNNATIAGVDSDNDGIRDDVQKFINEKYSNDLKNKLAAKQFATYLQQVLITTSDKVMNIEMKRKELDASSCWNGLGLEIRDSIKKAAEIESRLISTRERAILYKKSDLNFHGQSGTLPDNDLVLCEFQTE